MANDFSRTLSLLRQEKKISQRKTAQELGVSQALLSHYENGVREPGLNFVVRAADYYGVSTDYLLGRTMSRDGTVIDVSQLADGSQTKDNLLKGSASAMLSKKLLVNSVNMFFDMLGKSGNKKIVQHVSNYLFIAIYKMFRFVYMMNPRNNKDAFSISEIGFSERCDASMKMCEVEMREMTEVGKNSDAAAPEVHMDELAGEYPQYASSLLSVLHSVSEKLEKD